MNLRLLPLLGVSASALLALKLLGFALGPQSGNLPINGAVAQETPGADGGDMADPTAEMAADGPPPPPPPGAGCPTSRPCRTVLKSVVRPRSALFWKVLADGASRCRSMKASWTCVKSFCRPPKSAFKSALMN